MERSSGQRLMTTNDSTGKARMDTSTVDRLDSMFRRFFDGGKYDPDDLLLCAIGEGDAGAVQVAIDSGASPDAKLWKHDPPALVQAIMLPAEKVSDSDRKAIVQALLGAGAKRNEHVEEREGKEGLENGNTPLLYALTRGQEEVAEVLLDAGADPTARNKLKEDALHMAARGGHTRIVKKLLTDPSDYKTLGKIDPDHTTDDEWQTPLMAAAFASGADCGMLDLLCKAGADPDRRDALDRSALMLALRDNAAAAKVTSLLDWGASPGLQDQEGGTALMAAAEQGREDMLKQVYDRLLASEKLDPAARDRVKGSKEQPKPLAAAVKALL